MTVEDAWLTPASTVVDRGGLFKNCVLAMSRLSHAGSVTAVCQHGLMAQTSGCMPSFVRMRVIGGQSL